MELRDLTTIEQLEQVLAQSGDRPQLLFKHSLTCPISGAAHRAVAAYLGTSPAPGADYWLIAVQTARPVSNAIAERLGIRHESPRAILVEHGEPTWNASHYAITPETLTTVLAKAG